MRPNSSGPVSSQNVQPIGRGRIAPDMQPQGVGDSEAPPTRAPRTSHEDAIAEFAAPPPQIRDWLANPMLPAALKQVSQDLAPGGVATDKRARYAASVIETHMAARRVLAKHLNALLRA